MSSVDDDTISRRLRDFPEIDARVRDIPPEIATRWPGVRRVSLALGAAIRISLTMSQRETKRRQKAASRLVQEPVVQKAARHTAAIAARADHWPEGRDRDEWRRLTFEGEAQRFATAHHFPYLSPRDVAQVLAAHFAAVYREEDGPLPISGGPAIFVNPLADAELSAPVPPGHILVDLTYATTEDLQAIGPALREMQRRLLYHHQGGGRPRDATNWTKEEFLEDLPRARAAFEDRHLRKPTCTELAVEMGIPKPTFDRYRERWLSMTKTK